MISAATLYYVGCETANNSVYYIQPDYYTYLIFYSAIDEIVLSYVISILEDLGDDKNAEDNIDVDQFTEMMDAYIPGFCNINRYNKM